MVSGIKWESRRWASRAVRLLVFVIPLVAGVVVATVVATVIPGFDNLAGAIAWWVVVLGSSFAAVNLTDRLARKFLPLAALLDMSLIFPGAAPSRVKVAMRTWTTAQLQRRIREARESGLDDDPTRAGETVLLLVAALNAHDHVTRGHAERTRAFTDVLAEELGVPQEQREKLRWVSLLHDVGKLKIAASVLNKPGRLDEGEWEAIRLHPELGDELVAPIKDFLEPWGDTILHHHERWDGRGYPQGLRGEEINYGARIVAVADAYDAMTAARSYQPARGARAALRELSTNAGTQFDPTVVRAFLDISARQLRRLTGPLAMLAQIPAVAGLQRVAEWAGTATAGTAVVVAAVATGVVVPATVEAAAEVPTALVTTTTGPAQPGGTDPGVTTVTDPATSTTQSPATATTTTSEPTTTTSTTSAPMSTSTTAPPATTTSTTVPATSSTTTTTVPPTTTTTTPPTTTTTVPPTTTTVPVTTTTTTAAPANQPPVAQNDSASGNPKSNFQIAVLTNDKDPDGHSLTLVSCATSAQGVTVSVNGNKCSYRHPDPESWTTPDTFTYTISDGHGGTASATVTLTPR